jgi:hypothetical protein
MVVIEVFFLKQCLIYLLYSYIDSSSSNEAPRLRVVDITDDRIWHATKYYSHYLLGILFLVMAVLFTIRFWEISDFSNRAEIKVWLHKYVSDGWWRRGGLNVAISMSKGLLALGVILLAFNAFATQASAATFPENRIIGSCIAVGISVVFIIWLLGYIFIRFTEAAFVRYYYLVFITFFSLLTCFCFYKL